jgi:hypothetical protein
MASQEDHENAELANRLTAAADGIVNSAAVGLEHDLRSAAEILREIEKPTPLISKLTSEPAKIANACPDAATVRRLRRLLGEAS